MIGSLSAVLLQIPLLITPLECLILSSHRKFEHAYNSLFKDVTTRTARALLTTNKAHDDYSLIL